MHVPTVGTYKMPIGGIGTWYASREHTRIADKDAKLLDFLNTSRALLMWIPLAMSFSSPYIIVINPVCENICHGRIY